MNTEELITYAQNREDIILSGFFDLSKKGFYVDVGAYDPFDDSVTKLFYDKGWHGINIEPIPKRYKRMQKERPRDINLNIGIASKKGTLQLREYEGAGLSTFSPEMKKEYDQAKNPSVFTSQYIDYTVQVKTLSEIFKEQKVKEIKFLKVDVEGFEHEVLKGNDWVNFRPQVICIEANHVVKENDWRPLLKRVEYDLAFFDGLNEYYIDKTQQENIKVFSYVDTIIFHEPIVNYRLLPKLQEREEALARLEKTEHELRVKDQQVEVLTRQINDMTPLRRHVLRQLKQRLKRLDQSCIQLLQSRKPVPKLPVMSSGKNDLLKTLEAYDETVYKKHYTHTRNNWLLRGYLSFRALGVKIAEKVLRG